MSPSRIPKTMKAVQMQHTGGPDVLLYKTDMPVPVPGEGEVLVKNSFIGINYVDVYWRIGMMGTAPNGIIGREGEGEIVAVGRGSTDGLKVGDRVVWLNLGGYAEYTAVPASSAYLVPQDFEAPESAGVLLQGLFSLTLVEKVAPTQKGGWALVHAAAGGVGLWLCQLLKARGVRVIGTASTKWKIEAAYEAGAEFVINYKEETDLVKKIADITGGHGVDVVYDGIGKDQTTNNIEVVATRGTIVTYGAASGFPGPIPPGQLAAKKVRYIGPGESALMRNIGGQFHQWCEKLFETMKKDQIKVKIGGVYLLSDIRTAHEDLEGRKTMGKLLARP